jgi:hypothetical protein
VKSVYSFHRRFKVVVCSSSSSSQGVNPRFASGPVRTVSPGRIWQAHLISYIEALIQKEIFPSSAGSLQAFLRSRCDHAPSAAPHHSAKELGMISQPGRLHLTEHMHAPWDRDDYNKQGNVG